MSKKHEKNKKDVMADKRPPINDAAVENESNGAHMALDDARRVKVLSPSMLVMKRFVRNKLAITGSIILIFMFLLSFLGGAISPYSEGQTFDALESRMMPYALGSRANNLLFVAADGQDIISDKPEIVFAIKNNLKYSTGRYSRGIIYLIDSKTDSFASIYRMTAAVDVTTVGGMSEFTITELGDSLGLSASDEDFKSAYANATETIEIENVKDGAKVFSYNGTEFIAIVENKTSAKIYAPLLVGMSTNFVYDVYNRDFTSTVEDFDFKFAFEDALVSDQTSFIVKDEEQNDVEYRINNQPLPIIVQEISDTSDPNYDRNFDNTIANNGFKDAVIEALNNGAESFVVNGIEYRMEFVEYEITAYGKNTEELDKIVKATEFEEALHSCIIENEVELTTESASGFPRRAFSSLPYIGRTTSVGRETFYTDADDASITYNVKDVAELIEETDEAGNVRLYFETDAGEKRYVVSELTNYTVEYNSGVEHYIVKVQGSENYFAKFEFLNTYDVVYTNDAGEEVVYAEAMQWNASNIQRVEEDGSLTDFAYVSNFSVKPHPDRGAGLELELAFQNIVREKCAAMPTSSQPNGIFNYVIWVRDFIEPQTIQGEDGIGSIYIEDVESNPANIPVSETGIVRYVNANGEEVFVIAAETIDEAGNTSVEVVEIRYRTLRSAITESDVYGQYYLEKGTNERIYLNWPVLISSSTGQYYTDQNGATVTLQSDTVYTAVRETDEDGSSYYVNADNESVRYPTSEVTLQEEENEDGSISMFFEAENGDRTYVKTELTFTAISASDAEGVYYTTTDGEKVYTKTITATSNENTGATEIEFTVTDAFGNVRQIEFESIIEPERVTIDGKDALTENVAENPRTFFIEDLGVHYLYGEDDASASDDRLYVYWIREDGGNVTATRMFIEAATGTVPAIEGEVGAYKRDVEFEVEFGTTQYVVRTQTLITVYDVYSPPSSTHLLGTDAHGMDTMTRIMYGGRISLMVGFVVIFIEMLIGVVIGGFSGYFGGVIDTILMRFVDLFNCIPYWPMMLIGGSLMDAYDIGGTPRIFVLMAIMGVLGWTGVARIVRGQILSLREQDFMVATEATGIRVNRRIFKHLVPNVMPLLIVQATMGLGGIIISEATLSYLGLGVQYPQASWGSILNSIKTAYEMTNYWYIWVPAGLCIMLTVLGFNFVGDGLRDAFDPKMKR